MSNANDKNQRIKNKLQKTIKLVKKTKENEFDKLKVKYQKLVVLNKQFKKEIASSSKNNFNLELGVQRLKNENFKSQKDYFTKAKTFQDLLTKKFSIYQKKIQKEKMLEIKQIQKYANFNFFVDIIEPFLNLKIAIENGKQQKNLEASNYVIGFEMLFKQMNVIMKKHNLLEIAPKIGQEFDSQTMKAIDITKDKKKQNKIIKIIGKGYKLHNRVIKPALVVVGK